MNGITCNRSIMAANILFDRIAIFRILNREAIFALTHDVLTQINFGKRQVLYICISF